MLNIRHVLVSSVLLGLWLTPTAAAADLISILQRISPGFVDYQFNVEQKVFIDADGPGLVFFGSVPGDVTALLEAVDVDLGIPGNTSTSGCEAGDFGGFTPGHVALMLRGTCFFSDKIRNAEAAGATGAIIFDNALALFPSSTLEDSITVPAVFATRAVGEELFNLLGGGNVTVRVAVVPQPAALILLGGGLAALALFRRRMR